MGLLERFYERCQSQSISLKSLETLRSKCLNPSLSLLNYNTFNLLESNKLREINEPEPLLKKVQQIISTLIYEEFPFHFSCHSVPGRSVVTNAEVHNNHHFLLKTDISKFYDTIIEGHITKVLKSHIEDWGQYSDIYVLIKEFCVINWNGSNSGPTIDRFLPTGAPSSPAIANMIATVLDFDLDYFAWDYGYKYSRYMDDLTFSPLLGLVPQEPSFLLEKIDLLLGTCFLKRNEKKTEVVFPNSHKQYQVTGVNVLYPDFTKTGVRREIKRLVRARLNNLTRKDKLDDVTQGYLSYIYSIDKEEYSKLIKYWEKKRAKHDAAS